MSNPKKIILVAVDFEQASLEALYLARDLGQKLALDVVLLHVYTVPLIAYPTIDVVVAPSRPEDIVGAANRAIEHLAASEGNVQTMLREGDPATEIIKVVDELRPAFVVLGTHGRRGIARLFLGSVAERVARASASPVLIVRASEENASS